MVIRDAGAGARTIKIILSQNRKEKLVFIILGRLLIKKTQK
jgi:hypothetical protein